MPKPFTPQGNTGGGINIPGLLPDGRPADIRSEGTEYERAARQLALPQNRPYSIISSMINPQQAAFVDAIREGIMRRQQETGYSYSQPPGMSLLDALKQ